MSLRLEHLGRPGVVHSLYFERIRLQLLLLDHGLAHHTRLLVKGVLHEFVLQREVLELLLLLPLPLQVFLGVEYPEAVQLGLLSMFNRKAV